MADLEILKKGWLTLCSSGSTKSLLWCGFRHTPPQRCHFRTVLLCLSVELKHIGRAGEIARLPVSSFSLHYQFGGINVINQEKEIAVVEPGSISPKKFRKFDVLNRLDLPISTRTFQVFFGGGQRTSLVPPSFPPPLIFKAKF